MLLKLLDFDHRAFLEELQEADRVQVCPCRGTWRRKLTRIEAN